jgi:hypothetical protein
VSLCELETLHQQQQDILTQIMDFVRSNALVTDLYNVEKELFRLLLSLGKEFLKEVIARLGTGKVAEVVDVKGERLPYQDDKKTTYLSIFGEVTILRAYYWRKGHVGICPLDDRINLPVHCYSYLLDDWVQRALTEEPYDKAVERFSKILGIPVSKLGQQCVAREAGVKFDAYYRQKPTFEEKTEGSHIGMEVDGKGVRMIASEKPEATEAKQKSVRRGKGEKSGGLRKMAVATVDFTFNPEDRTPEEMVSTLMREVPALPMTITGEEKPRMALNQTVAASMTGKQAAIDAMLDRVRKRDSSGSKKIVVLMDGDPALEEQMMTSLHEAGMADRVDAVILDIMHAMEYLWDAGTALYGERARERIPWVRKHALAMLKGDIGYVIGGLRITQTKKKLKSSQFEALKRSITYFENHKHMMRYDRYLKAGYPIATGLVEGTCGSLIKDRADRSGSRWSSVGAQAVLNERAIMKNGEWDSFWKYHMNTEKERLYGQFKITAFKETVNQN